MWRDDAYLLDMLLGARKAREFVAGLSREEFGNDEIVQSAVMRMVQIVGEAAGKLSGEFRAAHPGLPWAAMTGMRNRLVHDYFGIDLSLLWDTVQDDLPALIHAIEPLVPKDET